MQHTLERLSFPSVRSFRFDRVHQTAHRTAPRFSRRLFGADPREVSQYLVEVDQATQPVKSRPAAMQHIRRFVELLHL
jgi:hypothetical protein